jgi:hypothetical protein
MSTDFDPLKKIRADQLFDGRLDEFGIYEHVKPEETTSTKRCLTDGSNYLWVFVGEDGFVVTFTRYAANGYPGKILNAVREVFETHIPSEYEPQYWGFDTQEEWDAELAKQARQAETARRKFDAELLKFEAELLRYLRGEPNKIKVGTDEETKAKIAQDLVDKDPTLLLPINRDQLRREINSTYAREIDKVPF